MAAAAIPSRAPTPAPLSDKERAAHPTKLVLGYLDCPMHHGNLIISQICNRIFGVDKHPLDRVEKAAQAVIQTFASESERHDSALQKVADKPALRAYRGSIERAIQEAARRERGRPSPVATILGSGWLEAPAIDQLARSNFPCQLLDVDLSAVRKNHGKKAKPPLSYKEVDLSGGLFQALYLLVYTIDPGLLGSAASNVKDLDRRINHLNLYFKNVARICETYPETPDESWIELFGGASHLAISINVASQIGASFSNIVNYGRDALANQQFQETLIGELIAHPERPYEQRLSALMANRYFPAMRSLMQKIRLLHVRTLVECARRAQGSALFADTFGLFSHPPGNPSKVISEDRGYAEDAPERHIEEIGSAFNAKPLQLIWPKSTRPNRDGSVESYRVLLFSATFAKEESKAAAAAAGPGPATTEAAAAGALSG